MTSFNFVLDYFQSKAPSIYGDASLHTENWRPIITAISWGNNWFRWRSTLLRIKKWAVVNLREKIQIYLEKWFKINEFPHLQRQLSLLSCWSIISESFHLFLLFYTYHKWRVVNCAAQSLIWTPGIERMISALMTRATVMVVFYGTKSPCWKASWQSPSSVAHWFDNIFVASKTAHYQEVKLDNKNEIYILLLGKISHSTGRKLSFWMDKAWDN